MTKSKINYLTWKKSSQTQIFYLCLFNKQIVMKRNGFTKYLIDLYESLELPPKNIVTALLVGLILKVLSLPIWETHKTCSYFINILIGLIIAFGIAAFLNSYKKKADEADSVKQLAQLAMDDYRRMKEIVSTPFLGLGINWI